MARRKPLHTLCALFALVVACSPLTAETSEVIEEVILTADDPVAAFEVSLCISGDAPDGLSPYGSFGGTVSTNEGEVEFTLEVLDAESEVEPTPHLDIIDATSAAQTTSVSLDSERNWGGSGQRCKEQVVQLSVPSLAEGQTVTVSEIGIDFRAEWGGICPPSPDDMTLSIEAVRL